MFASPCVIILELIGVILEQLQARLWVRIGRSVNSLISEQLALESRKSLLDVPLHASVKSLCKFGAIWANIGEVISIDKCAFSWNMQRHVPQYRGQSFGFWFDRFTLYNALVDWREY